MSLNNRKVAFYRDCAARHRLIWTRWWLLFISVLIAWATFRVARVVAPHALWPVQPLYVRVLYAWTGAALLILLALTPKFLFAGLFGVRFRYVALWMARMGGVIRRWLLTGWRIAFLLVSAVTLVMAEIARIKTGGLKWAILLDANFALRAIALSALVSIVIWAYKARKRMVILPFTNYFSDDPVPDDKEKDKDKKDVKASDKVGGIATRLLSQLASLAQLYCTIDEMTPKNTGSLEGVKIAEASIKVQDVGEALQGMVSGESKVGFGPIEVPIGALIGLVGRIVQGPRMTGSFHRDGSSLTLIANLTGSGPNRTWSVKSAELEFVPSDEGSVLTGMVQEMAYRIFTDLVPTGSSNWRAVRHYSQGLRFYREQLKTMKGRKGKLRRAEASFIRALSEDNEFAQTHYNLGIVYKDQKKTEAAEVELRKVTAENPRFPAGYYALADIAKSQFKYDQVLQFSGQVISLQADNVQAWALKGFAQRYQNRLNKRLVAQDPSKAWAPSIESRDIATALAWRALCRASWNRAEIKEAKATAQSCLLASAVGSAMATPAAEKMARISSPIFDQALALDPANAEVLDQLASVLEAAGQYAKAAESYTAALRIREDATMWPKLTAVYARIYGEADDPKDKKKYKEETMSACAQLMNYIWKADSNTVTLLRETYKALDEPELSDRMAWVSPLQEGEHCPSKIAKAWPWACAQKAIRTAAKCFEQKKYALAQRCLESAIEKLGDGEIRERQLYFTLSRYYKEDQNIREALDKAKEAAERNPLGFDEHKLLAGLYQELGDYKHAETEWQVCLDIRADDTDILQGILNMHWARGTLTRQTEDRSKAFARVIEIFNETLELSEDWETQRWIHYWLGRFHLDQRSYDWARYHFSVAKSMDCLPFATRFFIGSASVETKAWDYAEDEFREARTWLAGETKRSRKKGETRSQILDKRRISTYDLSDHEFLIIACLFQAMMYAERGVNLKMALRLTRKASCLIARASEAGRKKYWSWQQECIGLVRLQEGKIDDAITELRQAIAKRVEGLLDEGGSYYHLALAYLAKARTQTSDCSQFLERAQECCIEARRTSIRRIYEAEFDELHAKLTSLETKLAAQKPQNPDASNKPSRGQDMPAAADSSLL